MSRRPSSPVAAGTSRPRLAVSGVVLALGLTLGLGACAEDAEDAEPTDHASHAESSSPSGSPTDSPSESGSEAPSAQQVDITIEGKSVTPNGERVEAKAGEPIELVVTADAPGEFHVHSTPEQELSYDAGTTTLPLTIERPGVVDVESHDLGIVVVQLEVR